LHESGNYFDFMRIISSCLIILGKEAIGYLQKNKADLVISDLMMPYMDGFELVKNLKSNDNCDQLPLLIVSARTNEEDKIRILELGADEIIAKPFSPRELQSRIQNMLTKQFGTSKLLELFEPKASQDGLEQIIAKKLETLILEHIDDPNLGIYHFSDALAASERKVFRLVKRIFEMTPLDLIKETRWKYLETIIQSGQKLTATEAGKAIGMTNVSYFKKQFSEKFEKSFDEFSAAKRSNV
jgi:CheY-like chemotaxis protein